MFFLQGDEGRSVAAPCLRVTVATWETKVSAPAACFTSHQVVGVVGALWAASSGTMDVLPTPPCRLDLVWLAGCLSPAAGCSALVP